MTALTDPISTDLVAVAASSGTTMKLTLDNLVSLALTDVTLTVLTSTAGTYTPPAGSKDLLIFAVGGGGGGSGGAETDSAGGGGGGGGTCIKLVASTGVTNGAYSVGLGGSASTAGTGAAGANTTFNIDGSTTITAGGGGAGTAGAAFSVVGVSVAGGAGGTATNGDLNIPGSRADPGIIYSGTNGWPGMGGHSVFGFGGPGGAVNTAGVAGTGYGGGGGGGHASGAPNREGAAGANGTVFVLEFYA